jgi:hypothetical protein
MSWKTVDKFGRIMILKEFGLVEDKIYEIDFFLRKKKECTSPQDCKYYVRAFFSASRSVTFILQSSMKGSGGFESWYTLQQEKLKQSGLAKNFEDMRNKSKSWNCVYWFSYFI